MSSDLMSKRRNAIWCQPEYVLCASFSFWICCTITTMATTNIMLLKSLKRDHKNVYDQQADTFTVYDKKTGDTIAVFGSNEKGLYLFTPDMNVRRAGLTFDQDTRSDHLMNHDTNLLATVKENTYFYTVQQFKDAKHAQELYHILGAPYTRAKSKRSAKEDFST